MTRKKTTPRNRVTVRTIATQAGVSIGAVSSVLNNRHVERRIAFETVEKIRGIAQRLGYIPNLGARRLRSGTAERDSIVLAFITSYEAPLNLVSFLVTALRASVAEQPGWSGRHTSLVVEMFSAGNLKEMPGLLTGDHFNAAIITNTTAEDDQFLERNHLPYPVVLVNRSIPRYSCVVEDPAVGHEAAEMLLKSRKRRLAVLYGTPLTQSTKGRVDRFMRTVAEKIGHAPFEIVASGLSEVSGYEGMRRFLEKKHRIDGLYVVTDGLALGAYRAIKHSGLRIPRDVAVVGVGDSEVAEFFDPPLSVAGVSRSETGKEAIRLLMRQLEQSDLPPLKVEIPVSGTRRESSGRK